LVANNNGIAKKNLLQKTSYLSDKPRIILLGTLGFVMAIQLTFKQFRLDQKLIEQKLVSKVGLSRGLSKRHYLEQLKP
jgi:hypothetical protein